MTENIFVGVMVVIAAAAGIWGWRLEHCCGEEKANKKAEKDGEKPRDRV